MKDDWPINIIILSKNFEFKKISYSRKCCLFLGSLNDDVIKIMSAESNLDNQITKKNTW